MRKYTWIVTRDEVDGSISAAVRKVGTPGEQHCYRLDRVITGGKEFRLLMPAGQVKFSGFILGDYGGLEPTDEFGRDIGCVSMQCRNGGRWLSAFDNESRI